VGDEGGRLAGLDWATSYWELGRTADASWADTERNLEKMKCNFFYFNPFKKHFSQIDPRENLFHFCTQARALDLVAP
jgi:hypothetical protein